MTERPTWDTHEVWLPSLLGPLDDDVTPTAVLVCFADGEPTWLVDARRERADDRHDPVTELAVTAAEVAPSTAVIAIPARMRDRTTADGEVLARVWVLTTAVRRPGGVDLRVRALPVGGIGAASDLEVDTSPVASVLDDALRHRLGEGAVHALYTAASWGHDILTRSADLYPYPDDVDRSASRVGRPTTVTATAEAARHRLGRHAADLAARHRPTASLERAMHRPAVHAATPDGWQAACPV